MCSQHPGPCLHFRFATRRFTRSTKSRLRQTDSTLCISRAAILHLCGFIFVGNRSVTRCTRRCNALSTSVRNSWRLWETRLPYLTLFLLPASVESLFAFYYTPVVPFTSSHGWKVYDPQQEFSRQGVGRTTNQWRFTDINKDYEFSPTYPSVLVVPANISDAVLNYAVKFRSKGRLPALSYIHRKDQISITRSSQPLAGLSSKRSAQDEKLVECIFSSGVSPSNNNLIVDARPTVNAMANSVTGAGIESMENYKNCRLSFSGIDNIHVVRDSFNRVLDGGSFAVCFVGTRLEMTSLTTNPIQPLKTAEDPCPRRNWNDQDG